MRLNFNRKWKSEIKVVCAYCGKPTGQIDGKGVEGVSHGLCPECLVKLRQAAEEEQGNVEPDSSSVSSDCSEPVC